MAFKTKLNMGNSAVRSLFALMAVVMLAGCESEQAAFSMEDRNHAITILREKMFPWSSEYDTYVVVSRLPQCQRKYPLKASSKGSLELYAGSGERQFFFSQGKNWYFAETDSCGSERLEEEPKVGEPIGSYRDKDGSFKWVAAAPAKGTDEK